MGSAVRWFRLLVLLLAWCPSVGLALSADEVERWKGATQALQEQAAEAGIAGWHPARELRSIGESAEALRQAAQELPNPGGAVASHGYDDVDAWAAQGGRIYRAVLALQAGNPQELQGQFEVAIQQIEDNPNLDEAAKEAIVADIEQQREQVVGFFDAVGEADRRAVEPYEAELLELLGRKPGRARTGGGER